MFLEPDAIGMITGLCIVPVSVLQPDLDLPHTIERSLRQHAGDPPELVRQELARLCCQSGMLADQFGADQDLPTFYGGRVI